MDKLLLVLGLLLVTAIAAQGKTSRTYYDEALMGRIKQKLATEDWAKAAPDAARASCAWLTKMSDQELWDFIPPPEQLRAINVSIAHDCPTCGDEITRRAGHYPWLMSRDRPFKVECPVCHGVFPSNDFQPWNTEGLAGKPDDTPGYVDRGLGWLDRKDDRRYYFVPYYIFWQRWSKDILGGIRDLRTAYLLTGDPIYAHKCAVMLCKIASEYERFEYAKQCYHEGVFGVGGRISDYIWSTGDDSNFGLSIDAIWPILGQDAGLTTFLAAKGVADAPGALEKMLNVMAGDIMAGRVAGNMGMHQKTLSELAIVLSNDDPARGPTTADMRKWLMSGPGRVEDLLWNGFWREGLGGESSPGYASGWCLYFYEMAALLPRLGEDIWANPKLKKMADIGLDMTVIGSMCPSIGDCGSNVGTGKVAWTPELQGPAFMHYGDPRHAQALAIMGASSQSLFEELFDEQQVKATLAKVGPKMTWQSRNLGGYGLALLERGQGENARALSLYYGDAAGGHGHYDRLNIELFAFGKTMMPDDGYPTPFRRPDFHEWRRCDTCRHYSVQVDEEPHHTLYAGQLRNFAVAPELQVVEAGAEVAYSHRYPLYRRTAALVDISADRSYLVDIFRVRGGSRHDWCFHGPPFPEFKLTGGALGPMQEKGTLAGVDVPYGAKPPSFAVGDVQALGIQGAKGVLTGAHYNELGPKGWAPHAAGVCTTKVGAELTATIERPVPAGPCKLFLEVWDYNDGACEFDLTLGGTVLPLKYEASGAAGYRWVSVQGTLPQEARDLKIAARAIGQRWALINRVLITRDVTLTDPMVSLPVASSGYQGFWNVQRMKPAGAWQATWRQPAEDLSLTLTVPSGVAGEVISCLGEPELVPGVPKTVQYVLGRNDAPAGAKDPLFSRYAVVVEPHKGAAAVKGVEALQSPGAPPETVGLKVTRAGATDLLHSALDGTKPITWQGATPLTVSGEYALVTLDAQGVQRACLVNGTSLKYGNLTLDCPAPPAGKVVAVDHKLNTITLDSVLPNPDAYRDRVVICSNELHQTSYMIVKAEVRGNQTVLSLGDVLCVVGMGAVAEFDQAAGVLVSDREFGAYGRTEHDRHAGRWIYNEDKSQAFRLAAIEGGKKLKLAGVTGDLATVFADKDGDGRRLYWISDVGPGDDWRLPTAVWVKRQAPGIYAVEAPVPVTFTLPRGG